MKPSASITTTQLAALARLTKGPSMLLEFSLATATALRKRGLIASRDDGCYEITVAGRLAYEEHRPTGEKRA